MDTYFYYYNHANRYHNQFSGDCSCSCFTCLYKLDLIFLLIVIYLLLMDKITINIQTADGSSASGTLPLLPVDEDDPGLTSTNSSNCNEEPDESPNSLPESVHSSSSHASTTSTTTSGRKLIKPDISLDFLDASDEETSEDEEDDGKEKSKENGESDNYCQDNLCNEEIFSNVCISSKGKRKSCFNVKRQSSVDSDSLSWDSSSVSSSSSSLSCPTIHKKQQHEPYSSLPCNLIDNVYVHEALEVDLPFNLSLTFTELGHIRKALAREELDSMSFCHSVREQLVNGKLCSTCLKTRFKLFGPWADCCRLCERPVCSRCSSNVQINAKRYNSIPIQLLVPNKRYRQSFTSPSLTSPSMSPLPSNPAKMKVNRQKSTSSLSFTSSSSSSSISLPIQTPSSVLSSSSAISSKPFNRLNQWKRSKGSFTSSLPWLRKTASKDGNKGDEDGGEEDDDDQINRKKDKNVSTMVIKLCLDCEVFFVTLLAI
uniref:Uncharacterized protein n=1 Tax=Tetranychus urticae TaxID=32264 RepID=T1KX71_TETUR